MTTANVTSISTDHDAVVSKKTIRSGDVESKKSTVNIPTALSDDEYDVGDVVSLTMTIMTIMADRVDTIQRDACRVMTSDDEYDESFIDSLSPLLKSMHLFGMYFRWSNNKIACDAFEKGLTTATSLSTGRSMSPSSQKVYKVYAVCVVVLLWINGIRMLTIFTSNDKTMPMILNKVILVVFGIQCAIQQTAYFFACRNGKLDIILRDVRLKSSTSGLVIRNLAVKFAAAMWIAVAIFFVLFIYILFYSGGLGDLMLTPFRTHIGLSDFSIARAGFLVVCLFLFPAYIFPIVMTLMLSVIFFIQFHFLNTRLRQVINTTDVSMSVSSADIEEIRQQHQTLCRSLARADRFLKWFHLAAFFGPLVNVIILLYDLILYPSLVLGHIGVAVTNIFWLTGDAAQLLVTSAGGIMVNSAVRIPFFAIINPKNLSVYTFFNGVSHSHKTANIFFSFDSVA